jgi:hypothetical protein
MDCKSCVTRTRKGFDGQCPACAAERTRKELQAERAVSSAERPRIKANGALTISRATNGLTGDRIRIEVRDPEGRLVLEVSPEDFGLAVTGASGRPCDVERRPLPGRRKTDGEAEAVARVVECAREHARRRAEGFGPSPDMSEALHEAVAKLDALRTADDLAALSSRKTEGA